VEWEKGMGKGNGWEWMGMDGPRDIFAHRVYNGLMNTLLSSVSTADDDGDQLFSM
jgi:hypothetical protein